MAIELCQNGRHRPNEHARVPTEISFAQKRFGKIDIRLFAKTNHVVNGDFAVAPQFHRRTLFDVTKTRTRPRRFNSDGDQRAGFFRRCRRRFHRFLKGDAIGDDMIGRKREHGCGMISGCDPTGGKRNRRCGVAFRRFCNDVFLREFFEQIAHGFFLFDVGQNENAIARNKIFQSRDGFLEERAFGDETQQLFGTIAPAQRPEPFAAAAGENEGIDRIRHVNRSSAPHSPYIGSLIHAERWIIYCQ